MAGKKINIQQGGAEVPLSSMIDVVFLLLIYFIITQKPIIEDTYLELNLPSNCTTAGRNTAMLTIDVSKMSGEVETNDYYYVNKMKMHANDVATYLRSIEDKETTVIVQCDPNARHKKLVRLLDICGTAGLRNLNLVNDESVAFHPEK